MERFIGKFQSSAALIALCGGHSPSHHERCASAIGSLPKCCGFVLDVMQFAKRLRVHSKKRKIKIKSKPGAVRVQPESSSCEAVGNNDSLDLVITESEFDKDVIKGLLAGLWVGHYYLVNA